MIRPSPSSLSLSICFLLAELFLSFNSVFVDLDKRWALCKALTSALIRCRDRTANFDMIEGIFFIFVFFLNLTRSQSRCLSDDNGLSLFVIEIWFSSFSSSYSSPSTWTQTISSILISLLQINLHRRTNTFVHGWRDTEFHKLWAIDRTADCQCYFDPILSSDGDIIPNFDEICTTLAAQLEIVAGYWNDFIDLYFSGTSTCLYSNLSKTTIKTTCIVREKSFDEKKRLWFLTRLGKPILVPSFYHQNLTCIPVYIGIGFEPFRLPISVSQSLISSHYSSNDIDPIWSMIRESLFIR